MSLGPIGKVGLVAGGLFIAATGIIQNRIDKTRDKIDLIQEQKIEQLTLENKKLLLQHKDDSARIENIINSYSHPFKEPDAEGLSRLKNKTLSWEDSVNIYNQVKKFTLDSAEKAKNLRISKLNKLV